MLTDLKETAANLPSAWKSAIIGGVASANIKVLRMDESVYEAESHDEKPETQNAVVLFQRLRRFAGLASDLI
jgi:hypothetical protein